LTALINFHLLKADDTLYKIFSYVADTTLYYLPIMVTFPVALLVFGPLGYYIGAQLITLILWLNTLGWLLGRGV